MMKISVLFRGSLRQLNGAASVVKLFDEHKDIFENEGIDFVKMFSYDCIDPKSYSETRVSGVNNAKETSRKSKILASLNETYLGSCVMIEYLHIRRAKKLVSYYMSTTTEEDVLIFHDTFTFYEYLKASRKNELKQKTILIHHNTGDEWKSMRLYYPKIRDSRYYRRLEKLANTCYEGADAIVFVSEMSKENFIKLRGRQFNSKIHVIKNGVNDIGNPSQRDYSTLKLVTVGSVNERKNQLNLIKCLNAVQDESITLTIVGEGSTYEQCKEYISRHNLKQVKMLGSRTDVSDILADCNVFILPSLGEGLPMAGIEALRSGLPVVLTDVGGNRELIDGNGLLIGTSNEDILRAIKTIIESKDELLEMGRRSRDLFLEKFDAKKMIREYCSLVKGI